MTDRNQNITVNGDLLHQVGYKTLLQDSGQVYGLKQYNGNPQGAELVPIDLIGPDPKNGINDYDVYETDQIVMKTGPLSNTYWEYYGFENDGKYDHVKYSCYIGEYTNYDTVSFWSSKTELNSDTYLGGSVFAGAATYGLNTGDIEIPEGTAYITVNNRKLSGFAEEITFYKLGQNEEIQKEIDDIINRSGKVKEGLTIAFMGDSISTSANNPEPEIVIHEEDIGVRLGGWLTSYDTYPLTLGGVTYTSSDIGKYITFVPDENDIGKKVGTEKPYNTKGTKVWWEYLKDLGVNAINATYCSSSLCSHEKNDATLQTSYGWHDQQIRRCGQRIPGSMNRKAPDIIVMYRGCNDMTHTPYPVLTKGYFDAIGWTYPTDDVVGDGYGFKEAAAVFVSKIRKVYPHAQIVFATQNAWKRCNYNSFPCHNSKYNTTQFNKAIREIADFFGCQTVDFDKDGITFENMYPTYISDSPTNPTHPNNTGHKVMGMQAIKDLANKLDLFKMEPKNLTGLRDYQIVQKLSNAKLSYSGATYAGGTYTSTISTAQPGYTIDTVNVRMNDQDITSTAYNATTKTITVTNVTGDIIITNTSKACETVNLTQTLTNATSTYSYNKVNKGEKTEITIMADEGYFVDIDDVAITIGGTDVTASSLRVQADRAIITLNNPTDAVVITMSTTAAPDGYTPLFELVGRSGQAIDSGISCSNVDHVVTRIRSIRPRHNQGFGVFKSVFANELQNASTGNIIKFSTGANANTNVTVTAGKDYLIVLDDIDQAVSYLKVYDGGDFGLTNALDTISRNQASTTNVTYTGFLGSDGAAYSCTGQGFCYSIMYDSSNNITHKYMPFTKTDTGENGLYDLVTDTFIGFVNCA